MMKNLKLGQKLTIGFSIVLALAIISSIVAYRGFTDVTDRADKSDDVNSIMLEVLQMRRHEKDFMLRKDKKYIEQVHESANTIVSIAKAARDKHSKQADKDEKNQIIELANEYKKSFDEYVNQEKEKDNSMTNMRSSSKVVIASIKELTQALDKDYNEAGFSDVQRKAIYNATLLLSDVHSLFLEVRKGEKDVIIFDDTKYYDKLHADYSKALLNANSLKQYLTHSGDIQLCNEMYSNLEHYKQNFESFYTKTQEQKTQAEDLVSHAREVIAITEKAEAHQNSRMHSTMDKAKLVLLIFSVLAILFSIVVAIVITKNILNQLGGEPDEIEDVAGRISNGDLTVSFGSKKRIGAMRSLQVMSDNLSDIVRNIVSGSNNIAAASQQMSSSSEELSQGANEQASSVEEISSTMEEMTSNIEQNNDNAEQTQKISLKAQKGIADVNIRAQEAVEANKQISEKISIVQDIAFQTNILALNAAVEAARAGEHGKGFAVVAAEVRKLAERSKVAAEEIVSLSQNGLNLTQGASEKLTEMLPEIEKTTSLIQEISAASNEQTNGAGQVNNAMQQLNSVTQQTAASSEEMATSSEELASQADQLKELVAFFKVDNSSSYKLQEPNHIVSNTKSKIKSTEIRKGSSNLVKLTMSESNDDNFEQY